MVRLLRRDALEPQHRSLAKKAAAFRRISRSCRRIRCSFRSRASSARSAVVRPVWPFVLRSARAHYPSDDSVKPRSRASARVFPSSRTNRTAFCLEILGQAALGMSTSFLGYGGHHIPLLESVHQTGSRPRRRYGASDRSRSRGPGRSIQSLRPRHGLPGVGLCSLIEIRVLGGKLGLLVDRDLHFRAAKPPSAHAEEARRIRHILA